MRFQDKVAVVTGGASGIGAATVRLLAAEGAKVVVVDLNEVQGHSVVEGLEADRSLFLRCDVSEREQVEAVIRTAHERFGRLDVLFNNAGIGCFGETPDLDPEVWARVIAIDLNSVFYACRVAIPLMRANGGGAIVNTASISGLAGDYGFTAYNAAKGAVINYTRALAIDHAKDNIRVNALCPGLIDTPLTAVAKQMSGVLDVWLDGIPMRRAGTPEEMAKVVAFLASDDASYVTGTIMVADGGKTAGTGQPDLAKFLKA
ncbi:MAG TPA: SDR family NAD(P)-dependent oxidoreductase [Caulobacteraceae bacterium]|jgi:meso-butanediol dehydrogenase/(S,S)-butanediol dehydrogenase/diacetyl reductase